MIVEFFSDIKKNIMTSILVFWYKQDGEASVDSWYSCQSVTTLADYDEQELENKLQYDFEFCKKIDAFIREKASVICYRLLPTNQRVEPCQIIARTGKYLY